MYPRLAFLFLVLTFGLAVTLTTGTWGCRSKAKTEVDVAADTAAAPPSPPPPPAPVAATNDTVVAPPVMTDTLKVPKKKGNIRVTGPEAGDTLATDHFRLTGTARTFENMLSYRLVGSEGTQLASGQVMAVGSMGRFNPFAVNVNLRKPFKGGAVLYVFQNSAKDGKEIDQVAIPLTIGRTVVSTGVMSVEVYYTNAAQGSNSDCGKVFAVSRTIPRTEAIAEAAIGQLLQGPTMQEREGSYGTEIPAGAKLRSVTIDKGTATVDFNADLNRAAGSCRITAIRAQIERTLRQFPTVRKVVITVDGQSKGVLQP